MTHDRGFMACPYDNGCYASTAPDREVRMLRHLQNVHEWTDSDVAYYFEHHQFPAHRRKELGWERQEIGQRAPAISVPKQTHTEAVDEARSMQIGGSHYKDMVIQPSEFIYKNGLGWHEGNAIKYICRHKSKGGQQDLDKAIHYLTLLKEIEYDKS